MKFRLLFLVLWVEVTHSLPFHSMNLKLYGSHTRKILNFLWALFQNGPWICAVNFSPDQYPVVVGPESPKISHRYYSNWLLTQFFVL